MPALTEFEQRTAEIARTYCVNSRGEDAEGKSIVLARFLSDIVEQVGIQVRNEGGDPDYLPDEDRIFSDVRAAMQDAIDAEAIRNERAVA